MTAEAALRYARSVDPFRLGAPLAAIVAAVLCLLPVPARAGSIVDVGEGAVVRVDGLPGAMDLVVQTWDRNAVQIEAADDTGIELTRGRAVFGPGTKNALVPTIPAPVAQQLGPDMGAGPEELANLLGPEEFPFANFAAGPHDTVLIRTPGGERVTLTVPSSTGVLQMRAGGGTIDVVGYRGANLLAFLGGGRLRVDGASTNAFLQVIRRGHVFIDDGTFTRLRARTGLANMIVTHAHVQQIEATSVGGSIVFDEGSFSSGLARFETQRGSVALGVAGGAQVAARAAEGHLSTAFDRRPASETRTADGLSAAVGGGGPLVTVNAPRGGVLLYDGTLASRHDVPPEWRVAHRMFLQYKLSRNTPQRPPPAAASAVRREEPPQRPREVQQRPRERFRR